MCTKIRNRNNRTTNKVTFLMFIKSRHSHHNNRKSKSDTKVTTTLTRPIKHSNHKKSRTTNQKHSNKTRRTTNQRHTVTSNRQSLSSNINFFHNRTQPNATLVTTCISRREDHFEIKPVYEILSRSLSYKFLAPHNYHVFEAHPIDHVQTEHRTLTHTILRVHSSFFVTICNYKGVRTRLITRN